MPASAGPLPTGSNLDWGAAESVKVSEIVATSNLAIVPPLRPRTPLPTMHIDFNAVIRIAR